MSYTICKSFDFDAAHSLPLMPDGHKCKRLHGHTYRVEVMVRGDLDPMTRMVCDYERIEAAWRPVFDLVDHRCLNDIKELLPSPTTEVLAWWVMREMRRNDPEMGIVGVRVYESSSTWAETRADGGSES